MLFIHRNKKFSSHVTQQEQAHMSKNVRITRVIFLASLLITKECFFLCATTEDMGNQGGEAFFLLLPPTTEYRVLSLIFLRQTLNKISS